MLTDQRPQRQAMTQRKRRLSHIAPPSPAAPCTPRLLTYRSEPCYAPAVAQGEGSELAGIVALILHGELLDGQRGIPQLRTGTLSGPSALPSGDEGQPLLARPQAGEAGAV